MVGRRASLGPRRAQLQRRNGSLCDCAYTSPSVLDCGADYVERVQLANVVLLTMKINSKVQVNAHRVLRNESEAADLCISVSRINTWEIRKEGKLSAEFYLTL